MSSTARMDRARLGRFNRFWEELLQAVPDARRQAVEEAGAAVLYHAVEVFALPRGGGRQALVNVAGDERPCGVPADEVLIVLDLIAQRVQLFIRF